MEILLILWTKTEPQKKKKNLEPHTKTEDTYICLPLQSLFLVNFVTFQSDYYQNNSF